MTGKLSVPEGMLEKVRTDIQQMDIQVEVVTGGECAVAVREAEAGSECNASALYPGGWISCTNAWTAANKLEIEKKNMGAFLDLLDIKVRDCQLGCF